MRIKLVDIKGGKATLTAETFDDEPLKRVLAPFKAEPGMSWGNPPGCWWIRAWVHMPDTDLAKGPGDLAGICACAVKPGKHARLKSVVTLDAFRGRGLFAHLLGFGEELARETGVEEFSYFAGPASINAIQRIGYTIKSVRGPEGGQTWYLTKRVPLTPAPKQW